RAGDRLPVVRLRLEARADGTDARARSGPAGEPIRHRRRPRPLQPRAPRRRGAVRRPRRRDAAARGGAAAPAARERRRRGAGDAERLLGSDKDRAEHVMLVDLGRNDLSRVCRPGTVKVERFLEAERFSHITHLVSEVAGELQEGVTPFDLLRACFPAGTVSGAPKVRAMQIISELEQYRRGPYAGAVLYALPGGP